MQTKRIRTKKQLIENIYNKLLEDSAYQEIIPVGLRDLIVKTSKGRYRIRISKYKRSNHAV